MKFTVNWRVSFLDMNDKFLNTLGLCFKAGKLGVGHDASKEAVRKNKAALCILCCDASDRLKKEFHNMTNIKIADTVYSMSDIKSAIGTASGVLTVNDAGFAKLIDGALRKE